MSEDYNDFEESSISKTSNKVAKIYNIEDLEKKKY